MIDIRTLFDFHASQSGIDHRSITLAIFGNTDLGPDVLLAEENKYQKLLGDPGFMNYYAVYSMTAVTQGSYFQNEVCILPVARFEDYQALIISYLRPGNLPDHERYVQLVMFIPTGICSILPNIIEMKPEILRIVRKSEVMKNMTLRSLYQVKFSLLEYINFKVNQNTTPK